MSAPVNQTTVRAVAVKEKGGTPEDARQGKIDMEAVLQARAPSKAVTPFRTVSLNKKLAIWLDDLVEKSKDKPISQLISMTPEFASVLLERNPANRKINNAAVESYAHDIAAGRWAFNGEPIIVSDTGELNDGQHRCLAVVEAKRAIEVILIIGIKRDTRTTLDQGRARTAGDFLSMNGITYANVTGAVAGHVWAFRNRGVLATGSGNRATKSEIVQTVKDYPGIERSVHLVHQKGADAAGGKTILAFCHFELGAISREDADHYILTLISGSGLKLGDPALYVRNRLINERGQLRANAKAELIFKGWNAWRKGERVTRMLLTGGVLPVLER